MWEIVFIKIAQQNSKNKKSKNLPSQGSSLAGNTLLQAAVSGDHEGVVVEELEAGLVEGGSHVSLTDGQTNSVGETLTKGTLICHRIVPIQNNRQCCTCCCPASGVV